MGVVRRRQVHLERDARTLRNDGHHLQLKASHVPAADNGTLVEPHGQPATTGVVHDVISHGGYVQLATADEAGVPGRGAQTTWYAVKGTRSNGWRGGGERGN